MKMIQLNTSHMFIFHFCPAFAPFDLRALELVTSTLGVELHEVVLTSVTKQKVLMFYQIRRNITPNVIGNCGRAFLS